MRFNSKVLISIVLIIIFLLIGVFYLFNSKQANQTGNTSPVQDSSSTTSENVDFKASFAIYTNGTFRIFTASMYHDLSTDVFIEASNPNIINVKKSNITWRDFFATLPFSLDETCLTTGTKQTFCSNGQYILQFYLNGQRNDTVLDQTINPGDKLLVTYDQENSVRISEQLQSIPTAK